jgi:hypothetical protein
MNVVVSSFWSPDDDVGLGVWQRCRLYPIEYRNPAPIQFQNWRRYDEPFHPICPVRKFRVLGLDHACICRLGIGKLASG